MCSKREAKERQRSGREKRREETEKREEGVKEKDDCRRCGESRDVCVCVLMCLRQ